MSRIYKIYIYIYMKYIYIKVNDKDNLEWEVYMQKVETNTFVSF